MPSWFQIVASSALISTLISVGGNALLALWSARSHKLRKYEEELISIRITKCNELLQLVLSLRDHLSTVAKGTSALGNDRANLQDDPQARDEIKKTHELRVSIQAFVDSNSLFLGKPVCMVAAFFEAGFDQITYLKQCNQLHYTEGFYALNNWVWLFEDEVKQAIARALRDANFSIPSTLDIQSARKSGYLKVDELLARIHADPSRYSVTARNRLIETHIKDLNLPSIVD